MTEDPFKPLIAELDNWRDAGRIASFWLRDDDAIEPTDALDRLLLLTGRYEIPVTLAVIPKHTGQALADHLDGLATVSVAVHGWSHVNHAGDGEKTQELGAQRPAEIVLGELEAGFRHLEKLYPVRFVPVLVPPWNRIAPALVSALPALGFTALSTFGPEKPGLPKLLNTHVDLMDWRGTRGARQPVALVADITERLGQMRRGTGAMGFLTHHLVHDNAGWDFLDRLFEVTAAHPACRWTALADMLE